MQAYRWTAERVLRELNSAPGGLSRKQAAARLAKHGENRLARKKGDSLWRRFMLQLSDPMILVLLARPPCLRCCVSCTGNSRQMC